VTFEFWRLRFHFHVPSNRVAFSAEAKPPTYPARRLRHDAARNRQPHGVRPHLRPRCSRLADPAASPIRPRPIRDPRRAPGRPDLLRRAPAFHFDVHLFDRASDPAMPAIRQHAYARLAETGLRPWPRARIGLVSVDQGALSPFDHRRLRPNTPSSIRVRFVTPTELKGAPSAPNSPSSSPASATASAPCAPSTDPVPSTSISAPWANAPPAVTPHALRPHLARGRTPLQPHRPDPSARRLHRSSRISCRV
jgi:hypothetical protein